MTLVADNKAELPPAKWRRPGPQFVSSSKKSMSSSSFIAVMSLVGAVACAGASGAEGADGRAAALRPGAAVRRRARVRRRALDAPATRARVGGRPSSPRRRRRRRGGRGARARPRAAGSRRRRGRGGSRRRRRRRRRASSSVMLMRSLERAGAAARREARRRGHEARDDDRDVVARAERVDGVAHEALAHLAEAEVRVEALAHKVDDDRLRAHHVEEAVARDDGELVAVAQPQLAHVRRGADRVALARHARLSAGVAGSRASALVGRPAASAPSRRARPPCTRRRRARARPRAGR